MILTGSLGGPGPCTLAFRRSLSVLRHTKPRPALCCGSRRSTAGKTLRYISIARPSASDPAKNEDALGYTVQLPAPPDLQRYDLPLKYLRDALRDQDLTSAAWAYQEVYNWGSISRLEDTDWSGLSDLIARMMHGGDSVYTLGKTYHTKSELYGWISTMAIEAASRDHWQGLYLMTLSLIACGLPQAVIDACNRYRDAMYTIQGKDRRDLVVWNREKRLKARLEGNGVKPIYTINIAALTMLDQLDGPNLIQLLGTKTDWRHTDRKLRNDINNAFSFSRDSKQLISKYEEGLQKFLFAQLSYHPNSLRERLHTTARLGLWEEFDQIYGSILEGTIGTDRYIRPLDLGQRDDRHVNDVALPAFIWIAVIKCLAKRGQPAEIFRLIDVILPERGLAPTPEILACAMESFTILHTNSKLPKAVREAALGFFDQLTGYITTEGLQDSDEIIAAQVQALAIMRAYDPLDDLYYKLAQQGSKRNVGPCTRAALAHVYAKIDRFDRAIQILQWTSGPDSVPQSYLPYSRYIMAIIHRGSAGGADRLDHNMMMRAISQALKIKPESVELPMNIVALQAIFRIERNVNVGVQQVIDLIYSRGDPSFSIWSSSLAVILSHATSRHHTTPNEAEAGLKILAEYLNRMAKSQTRPRARQLWSVYLKAIGTSSAIKPNKRRKYLMDALKLFRSEYGEMSNSGRFILVPLSLSRNDRQSLSDALFWWNEFQRENVVTQYWWTNLINAFRRSNHVKPLVEIIQDCWNTAKLPKRARLWDQMLHSGLLDMCHISEKDLEEARRLEWKAPRRDAVVTSSNRIANVEAKTSIEEEREEAEDEEVDAEVEQDEDVDQVEEDLEDMRLEEAVDEPEL